MRKSENDYGIGGQRLLSGISLLTLIAVLAVGLIYASPMRAQAQTQAARATASAVSPTTGPTLEFEVATIKPNKSKRSHRRC